MAIGIAGDSPFAVSASEALSESSAQELLTQILIELRTQSNISINLQPYPVQDLTNLRNDQDLELSSTT